MNIYVGNLSPDISEQHIEELFSEFGIVTSAKILKDFNTGFSRGFGFVEMADKGHGFDAIDNLDTSYFMGQIISVREAKAGGGTGGNSGGGSKPTGRFSSRPSLRGGPNKSY